MCIFVGAPGLSLYAFRHVGISALRGKHVGGGFARRNRARHSSHLIRGLPRDPGWGDLVPRGLGRGGAIHSLPSGSAVTAC